MRRAWLWIIALILAGGVWGLRGNVAGLRFVVPTNAPVLYATTFDGGTLATDWSTVERRGATSAITEDALLLAFDDFVTRRELLRSVNRYTFGDFDLRVTATATQGDINNAFGVVLRQADNANTYLLFYISSDGYYSIWRETPNGRLALSTWIASEHVQQGLNVPNQLRVVAQGDTFTFYVNNQPLALCIPDSASGESTYTESMGCIGGAMQPTLRTDSVPRVGQIGMAIETQIDGALAVHFDDVLIVPPTP